MLEYLWKNMWYGLINILLVALPGLAVFKLLEANLGESDILIAAFAIPGLACLILNKFIVEHQVSPDVGYWKGWGLGLADVKNYIFLFVGR